MKTLADLFYSLERRARPDLLLERAGDGFEPISSADFAVRVRRCAVAFDGLGIGRGDRVGLICGNRADWHAIDFACHLRGAILVPIFSTLTAAQVRYIFADSGCKVVLCEGAAQVDKVASVRNELAELVTIVLVRPRDGASGELGAADAELGALIDAAESDAELPGPEDDGAVATIIYTSGTTGESKGVMLTHANLVSNMIGSQTVLACRPVDRALSVLPLCHVFQRLVDYTFFQAGAQLAYGAPDRLAEDYLLVRPTVVAGVPRLFERFRGAVLEKVSAGTPLQQRIFRWAERVGRRRAEHDLEGAPFGALDRLRFMVADRLVLSKIRAGAGGEIYHFISGGAALDPSLNWWFESVGLRLLQGYGLTETSPVISANPHDGNRIGTVGVPIAGIEVKIADDGEILTRGPHVMKGYWSKPEATAEVIVDGWLHTGDLGTFEDGYLSVTDRKKHILVTSTGKNVAPQPIENALAMSRYIEQVAVVGDDRRFIAALVVPDFALLGGWARARGKDGDPATLCADPDVNDLVRAEIDALQVDFARFERVRAFRLLPTPFSIEEGTLTPTLKAVRRVVEAKYADEIEAIYAEDEGRGR